MNTTLLQMTVLMLCGAGWRVLTPNRLSADQTRLVLTSVVYYFFLPVMVLDVLWQANIGWQSLQFSALAGASVLLALTLSWLTVKACRFQNPQTGTVLLAAAFPNVTYLGLPVLEQAFGSWARSVVIQIDLFAVAPLVFTIGIMSARHYGQTAEAKPKSVLGFFNAPPFWAAFLAVALNLSQVPIPFWLAGLLKTCAGAVAPLMIFSLGLALSWREVHVRNLPFVIPIVAIKLLLMPLFALWLAGHLNLTGQFKAAAVMDIAMPSMVLGIVLCDRYKLDSGLYAMAVTLTTALSLLSLPLWFRVL
ncbi:AEC family transporter [Methylomonas montana]|uniref:AEC family transporter n=1 Tax=Methylomonas montana TaxID=3058963 RepID=UPI0026598E4A|nr:AEC family transporter [Methylomonas montana]WKJ92478.1 AEC family transporter [Methylomonas montana]